MASYWNGSIYLNEVVYYLEVQDQISFNSTDFQTFKLEGKISAVLTTHNYYLIKFTYRAVLHFYMSFRYFVFFALNICIETWAFDGTTVKLMEFVSMVEGGELPQQSLSNWICRSDFASNSCCKKTMVTDLHMSKPRTVSWNIDKFCRVIADLLNYFFNPC